MQLLYVVVRITMPFSVVSCGLDCNSFIPFLVLSHTSPWKTSLLDVTVHSQQLDLLQEAHNALKNMIVNIFRMNRISLKVRDFRLYPLLPGKLIVTSSLLAVAQQPCFIARGRCVELYTFTQFYIRPGEVAQKRVTGAVSHIPAIGNVAFPAMLRLRFATVN